MFARDYDKLMNVLVSTFVQQFNDQWLKPYDFRTIDPNLMFFITTVFSKPRMTPLYVDHFIYMGLTYQFDFMTSSTHLEKKYLESKMIVDNQDKFL